MSASTVGRVLRELWPRPHPTDWGGDHDVAGGLRARGPGELIQIDTLHEYGNLHARYHITEADG